MTRVRVGGLAWRNGALLLMRYERANEPPLWQIPGGNIATGERLSSALQREFAEELALEIQVGPLWALAEGPRRTDGEHIVHCLFLVEFPTSQEPMLQPAHTSAAAVEWITAAALPNRRLYPNLAKHLTRPAAQPLGYLGWIAPA